MSKPIFGRNIAINGIVLWRYIGGVEIGKLLTCISDYIKHMICSLQYFPVRASSNNRTNIPFSPLRYNRTQCVAAVAHASELHDHLVLFCLSFFSWGTFFVNGECVCSPFVTKSGHAENLPTLSTPV